MSKVTKRQVREEARTQECREVLEKWFARSGWTMHRLIAEIEKEPRDPRGIPDSCPRALFDAVHADPIHPDWKIAVIIAGQHFANVRPWLQQQRLL